MTSLENIVDCVGTFIETMGYNQIDDRGRYDR